MFGTVGLLVLAFFHALRKAPLLPVGDPFLVESLQRDRSGVAGSLL